MCASSAVDLSQVELGAYFGEVRITPRFDGWAPKPALWPGHELLVVREAPGEGRVADTARWGLVPPWWASPEAPGGDKKPYPTYLARLESAPTQPTWRDAWHRRGAAGRCLVLVSHWFEWTGPKGARTQVKLWVPGHRVVAVAGLWSLYRETLTAAMITCAAAEDLLPVHDRMPAILHPSVWGAWLSGRAGEDLLGPPPPGIVAVTEAAA
ncbi:MAG: SOS response-associated peptidase family protein [Myxococcales bacterium]|nr:SOS response-associated peptidase family protein [Myxococcales bacterium]